MKKRNKSSLNKRLKANRLSDAEKIQKILRKEVIKTNSKLDKLERRHKVKTWAGKKLVSRLQRENIKAWNSSKSRVKIPKNLNITKMVAILDSLSKFNSSLTSSHKGIIETKNNVINSLKNSLSLEGKEVSEKDAEMMYEMLSQKSFSYFADSVGASEVWALCQDGREMNMNEDSFVDYLIANTGFSNDVETREHAKYLYEKYVL